MSGFVRQAGAGAWPDGSRLVWSVADGRRGRRWRAAHTLNGVLGYALLLEVDIHGRPNRLELTTRAGMLTLHPDDAGRSLFGNVVTPGGLRHLSLPWSAEHGLELEGSAIGSAVAAHRLAGSTAVGEGRTIPIVIMAADLTVSTVPHRFIRLDDSEWRIEPANGAAAATTLTVDPRGIPMDLLDLQEWPLELD